MIQKIELLAPAKNAQIAIAAIKCGADAVYMGAAQFSARSAAGNSIEDIAMVCEFAHQYYAKVYVAINTLIYDNELEDAETLIKQAHEAGADGLIIQDAGLLELDLPDMKIIASTQMDNGTPEKVKFLQDIGVSRAILARELGLDEIKKIHKAAPNIELECFVHGALCVGTSGRCFMSYSAGGRSGNRGQCAQPCRKIYTLEDEDGNTIVSNRYLLSLKDMNRSNQLEQMIDAGVTSFKIEGRLKDISYVVNTVGFYRQKLDEIIARKDLKRSSSGNVALKFEPNPEKTFNRGFTDYGMSGKFSKLGSTDTPKSMGEYIGIVKDVNWKNFLIDGKKNLNNGDGICFFDEENNLTGTVVNGMDFRRVLPFKMDGIFVGQEIYRNHDKQFCDLLNENAGERKVALTITIDGLTATAEDEDGNCASVIIDVEPVAAEKKAAAKQAFYTQMTRLGNTIFECADFKFDSKDVYFVPMSKLNDARRQLIEQLTESRAANRPVETAKILKNDTPYPTKELTYCDNVVNEKAKEFFTRHGVETIEPAAESGGSLSGRIVMTTKYCLRKELGMCEGKSESGAAEPMILVDEDDHEYEVHFLCGKCGMEIIKQ